MIRFLLTGVLFMATMVGAWADMRYEPLDLNARQVRITYEIQDAKTGNKVFIFPTGGFLHDKEAGQFKVESVFDLQAKRELEFVIQKDKDSGLPQIKITYDKPIKAGEPKTLQVAVIVNMPDNLLLRDANGRYVYEYETSHKFEFIVPKNHYLVYSNQPVFVFEKGDQLIVQQLEEKSRKIVLQTREMK